MSQRPRLYLCDLPELRKTLACPAAALVEAAREMVAEDYDLFDAEEVLEGIQNILRSGNTSSAPEQAADAILFLAERQGVFEPAGNNDAFWKADAFRELEGHLHTTAPGRFPNLKKLAEAAGSGRAFDDENPMDGWSYYGYLTREEAAAALSETQGLGFEADSTLGALMEEVVTPALELAAGRQLDILIFVS